MRKNRIEYFLLFVLFLVLFIVFEKNMFLWAFVGMIVFSFLARILAIVDKNKVQVAAQVLLNDQKNSYLHINVHKTKPLIMTNQLLIRYSLNHTLFNEKEKKEILIPLTDQMDSYDFVFDDSYCGQIQIDCESCALLDVFRLFSMPVEHNKINSCIIYPSKVHVQLGILEGNKGIVDYEGVVQNKKGHDLSEIYDIRKYEPGDDVRSIHWKLSQKIGDIVIREASNLSQYSVLVIPDLALENRQIQEMNRAFSLFIAICERLLENQIGFCIPLVNQNGVDFKEINNLNQFHESLDILLSLQASKHHGDLLKYLFLSHMEMAFTKFIVVGNGKFELELNITSQDRSVSVIHACADVKKYYYIESQQYFDAFVPTNDDETYTLYF